MKLLVLGNVEFKIYNERTTPTGSPCVRGS